MWLRRLVAVSMILSLFGMNGLVLAGLLSKPQEGMPEAPGLSLGAVVAVAAPSIELTVDPATIASGTTAALKWTASGNPTTCVASGDWSGEKTPYGAESTGRVTAQGERTYTIECENQGGKAKSSTVLKVGPPGTTSVAAAPTTSTGTSTSAVPSVTYCGGRLPCYGPKDVASHSGSGNCWGWNGERVINITGYDASYHKAKSGINSIEVSGVCGVDLKGALDGSVGAGGQTRNHNAASKNNTDRSMIPYFVGYYDPKK